MVPPGGVAEPLLSVLVVAAGAQPGHLRAAVDSVLGQLGDDHELVLAVSSAGDPAVEEVVRSTAATRPGIRTVTIGARTPDAPTLADAALHAATGRHVLFLGPDDVLAAGALAGLGAALTAGPDTDVLYADHDELDAAGARGPSHHKPAWSPERLRSHDYVGDPLVLRRATALGAGGVDPDAAAAWRYDLLLRTSEAARRIVHLPAVLQHRRARPPGAAPATADAARAVQAQLRRLGIPAVAEVDDAAAGLLRLEPRLRSHPLVSVVIPTAGSRRVVGGRLLDLVDHAIASIRDRSTYPAVEVVVVVDGRAAPDLDHRLTALDPRVRTVRNPAPFNFSEACNLGAAAARGEVLVFLNDDTEVVTPDWLERLVLFATSPGVGAAGPRLLFGDGRIQHAGIIGRDGTAGHRAAGFPAGERGHGDSLRVTTEALAVTGACLAVTREHFEAAGRFDPVFPLNFNDVDLCLRLLEQGLRTVVDPHTVLRHHESATREPGVAPTELEPFQARWRRVLAADPYDNPHLQGVGLEEAAPSPTLLRLRELTGHGSHPPRSWPFRVERG